MNKASDFAALRELFRPHIESFDHFLDDGLDKVVANIRPIDIIHPLKTTKVTIFLEEPQISRPTMKEARLKDIKTIYPIACRQGRTTYEGHFTVDVCLQFNGGVVIKETVSCGYLPIMLMSKLCNLRGLSIKELIMHKEEASEMGGYFICGGLERLCRLLILPKRNHPMGMIRSSYTNRGEGFSDKAVTIRCVREDQSSVSIKLYYLQNGSARIGFWARGREFLLPVGIILKALVDTNDREIYTSLTCYYSESYRREDGAVGTQLIGERAQIILDEVRDLSLFTRQDCLEHLGQFFRAVMEGFETEPRTVVAEAVLRDYIFVHLKNPHEKFNLLVFMMQKLYALVDQTAAPDNTDALQNQEVLLPGHLIAIYVKEKLEDWLSKSRRELIDLVTKEPKKFELTVPNIKKVVCRNGAMIGRAVENMIKTGQITTKSGLDLPQRLGMTIQAERLNFLRYISHFQSVHRGSAFAKMRTTSVRKLLPESWGFLCPVHTPDGEPCGLLNHMTSSCCVTSFYDSEGRLKDFSKIRNAILSVLIGIGMTPSLPNLERAGPPEVLSVLLDGCVIGSIASDKVDEAVKHIRSLKVSAAYGIPDDLEVGYVPLSFGGAYPGLYLFTSPSRFVRPVKNILCSDEKKQSIEFIGPFEQAFLEIKCPDGGDGGRNELFPATHEEIHPTGMLSTVANLTPWSDHNQSPRNMYQCQMAKQSMGFSSQALQFRGDVKLYHLQTPQSPIVRTTSYTKYCVDEFPTGTNAIVAVLAYTGYDMEDAMILNKSSVERGLCHGHIYQTESVDLTTKQDRSDQILEVFAKGSNHYSSIDSDGLPHVGQTVFPDEPYYSTYNTLTGLTKTTKLKGSEPMIVDYVSLDGNRSKDYLQKVDIRYRRQRNPVIGDKFSSRHGQKGVCSQLWPDIDMPFSCVTGMVPDLIINPHAFPSRMTIGMLLESIAAKGGCLNGRFIDATPFPDSFNDGDEPSKSKSLVDELGPLLTSYGFNYHGVEVLYSGVFGTELTCEIFIGPVYYQRLRHMVSDKFQVRSTGVIDHITKQPVGGRKRGGGIRFGEMERDSLLAHGASYLLHDRLHTCSDYHIGDVCSICGSLLTAIPAQQPHRRPSREFSGLPPFKARKGYTCRYCKTSKGMETVAMPYVFRYLTVELAAMNVKMALKLSNSAAVNESMYKRQGSNPLL